MGLTNPGLRGGEPAKGSLDFAGPAPGSEKQHHSQPEEGKCEDASQLIVRGCRYKTASRQGGNAQCATYPVRPTVRRQRRPMEDLCFAAFSKLENPEIGAEQTCWHY